MKIAVIGTGYVGLVTGTCFAELGNNVVAVDINKEKIDKLNQGIIPIYEPGLDEILKRNVKEKRLTFTIDIDTAIQEADVIFICVGTPPKENGESDLTYVFQVADAIAKNLNGYKVIVTKSTVPPGTTHTVKDRIKQNSNTTIEFDVASNPEFLREGEAVNDFMIPDRVVIGIESDRAKQVMESLYQGVVRTKRPLVITDIKTSELIKYAANAMLATRISFMNELSRLCDVIGADIKRVGHGIGLDDRIGPRFLQAGAGYGGSCFGKDVKSIIKTMQKNGIAGKILSAVEDVNEEQKLIIVDKIQQVLGSVSGKTIAILGLSFKPKTDDMRDAPSIKIINELQKLGATIKVYDPEAMHNAKEMFSGITYCEDAYEPLKDADAMVLVTEWNEFRNMDKKKIKQLLKTPIIIDGRNIYDPKEFQELGFTYVSIGRTKGETV